MTTETIFSWSDLINYNNHTYTEYLQLDKSERDKYMKFEVKATVGPTQRQSMSELGIDMSAQTESILLHEHNLMLAKLLFKQMKYHCGKPLKISLTEKGPGKHLPIIEYFERSKDYLSEYDYMLLPAMQYDTLLDEDLLIFKGNSYSSSGEIGMNPSTPYKKVGKVGNLDIYVTYYYPDEIDYNGLDCIIGKKNWVDADLVDVFNGESETEPNKFMIKSLMKLSFPVKRGFMRIQAKYEENGAQ